MAYKVLVVDDQAMPRQLFENMIKSSDNYELVACIDTAKVADIYCAKYKIDLILMDVVMNDDSNGLDVAAKIKKSYPDTKIIIMTSMPDGNFLEKAKNIGVDSFWYKEVQDISMLNVMDITMSGDHVYPDQPPVVKLGLTDNTELTTRELEVLRKMIEGYTDKAIADELDMSYYTVRFHINNMLSKTGCVSRTDLAIKAVRSGLIVPDIN
ncbi:MAG: response regulator transcription factor [Clostridia bacterium]|nr:response regulator transcription factor [Clostridia bacterium]